MLVMTAKLTKKRIILGIVTVGIIFCGIILVKGTGGYVSTGDMMAFEADEKIITEAAKIKTDDDRVTLLEKMGWEVSETPIEFMEVQIPEEFDQVYEKYNEIQLAQGLDLKKYAGKRAMRYTYKVSNYPTGEKDVLANILIYKNRLIGGDICSPQLNGFMHGLKMSENGE